MRLVRQGRVVVRREGEKFAVLFPNGSRRSFSSEARAEQAAYGWFRKRRLSSNSAGLGEIVFR
jgi:GGDEF domain-containing protein